VFKIIFFDENIFFDYTKYLIYKYQLYSLDVLREKYCHQIGNILFFVSEKNTGQNKRRGHNYEIFHLRFFVID